jgi:hypothetical protein
LVKECVLVQAANEADAARKVAAGEGHCFCEESREIDSDAENMEVEFMPPLTPGEGERVFVVTKQENHRSHTLIVAKNGEEALEKVKSSRGFDIERSEYVDTDASDGWKAKELEN